MNTELKPKDLEDFLKVLKEIKDKVSEKETKGLCDCILHKVNSIEKNTMYKRYMKRLWGEWSKFSGDIVNPVGDDPESLTKWDSSTKYGKCRRDLLDYLINEIETSLIK